jgi:carboxylesterase
MMDSVVLFHGLCGSSLELQALASHLRRAGFTVELPMIEGYTFGTGFSGWQQWLEQADKVIDQLSEASGQPVAIGGLSMGATLALGLAAKRNDISAVIALSTTLHYDGWAVPWYRPLLSLGHAIGCGRFYEYKESEPFGLKNEQLRAYVKKALAQNRISDVGGDSFSLGHLVEGDRLAKYVISALPNIHADLLVIHAIDDDVASVRNADLVLQKTSSAIKESMFLGNSYHIVTVDNERETVSAEVEFFLKETVSGQRVKNSPATVISQEYARFLRKK